uniref:Ig-like domain-containing protein n=1 Tax=Helobdella robusta TaxID=6412 RepID=T1EIZ2_HELRO
MDETFLEHPQSTDVHLGSDVTLRCRPPQGIPPPEVTWLVGGKPVELSDQVYVNEDDSSLTITKVEKLDEGRYACFARNQAGNRTSQAASLFVVERPRILTEPQNVDVKEGDEAIFVCHVTGDPLPEVVWLMPEMCSNHSNRFVFDQNSLRLMSVNTCDAGRYTCRASNRAGTVQSSAALNVLCETQPSFLLVPEDREVGEGREVHFSCQVTGNPMPVVTWVVGSKQVGRNSTYEVLQDGSLVVRSASQQDSGNIVCQAISITGTAMVTAKLKV